MWLLIYSFVCYVYSFSLCLLRQAGAEEERLATEALELAAKVRGGYLARRRAKAAALVRAEVKAPSMALTNREQQLRYALEVGGGNMIFMFPPEYKGQDRSAQYRVAAAPAWDEVKDESALTPELKKSMLSKVRRSLSTLSFFFSSFLAPYSLLIYSFFFYAHRCSRS